TQGYYFRSFTSTQKRGALSRGWKLTGVFRVEEGGGSIGVDFGAAGKRFDINVLRDGDHEVIQLVTEIVPQRRGLEIRETPVALYRTYELFYDPQLESAELWVDGVKRLTGYKGHTQFQEDTGLLFSSHVWRSVQGSASYKSVRFE